MYIDICKKEIRQVNKTAILQQTAYWSEVKSRQGWTTCAFDFKVQQQALFAGAAEHSYVESDVLVILRQISDEHYIAYVPYGPEIEPDTDCQGVFLEELSECLRPLLPAQCIMIRYDLAWQSHWSGEAQYFDENGSWLGPPAKQMQELRFNYSTRSRALKKSNTDILPSNTIFMDLKKDDQLLLDRMKTKTRYNIQLAGRKGVQVKAAGLENIDTWYNLYAQTCARNGIVQEDIGYFRTVLTARANNSTSPADVEMLLAEADGIPLAAMFLVVAGHRGTYLYGASADTHRNYMGTYMLQWEAMRRAKRKGCTEYDFFGVSPTPDPQHPLYGLYKFKNGFGGELFHRMGCWDYPLQEAPYAAYTAAELYSKGYHR
ncbi:peptidoglycan bridge formation glycyltransferase FemA/FemB family protein [Chitinophaga sp. G-6-1-13]|uniref:Peptidoglycan bridge formation glycyltransferase FemA/FemB family protein n=1 Tax=Chitinophaga fulva TaxID=2728842 RepID=A0A848GP39_9BACT|nr:peptidoglycan bridge formation glycyltransferase FemA/FemB family protein [Chitinophaga fulva]NML38762.1 peptidoglycan bridge formation glycyltransferase FemA/FemB family protein [Chitinophaga fulva]